MLGGRLDIATREVRAVALASFLFFAIDHLEKRAVEKVNFCYSAWRQSML